VQLLTKIITTREGSYKTRQAYFLLRVNNKQECIRKTSNQLFKKLISQIAVKYLEEGTF
jgi:hypothetical protein